MARKSIEVNVKRRIIAESMGRCMNPDCREKLFIGDGDIMEKAHIEAYCETLDNDYDNLIILCPNCHTKFDKNKAFTAEQVIHDPKNNTKEKAVANDNKNFFILVYI